jgi:branched-chain amino acid transport system substrate-binding protein
VPDAFEYADRLFPEPVDMGVAEPYHAVSSVKFGTRSFLEGEGGEGSLWYEGGGSAKDQAVQGITIYPPTRGVNTQGDPFEPVKIGMRRPGGSRGRTTRR